MQDFGAIDVAKTGDHGLVQQQRANGRTAAGDLCPGAFRIGVGAQRIRAKSIEQ